MGLKGGGLWGIEGGIQAGELVLRDLPGFGRDQGAGDLVCSLFFRSPCPGPGPGFFWFFRNVSKLIKSGQNVLNVSDDSQLLDLLWKVCKRLKMNTGSSHPPALRRALELREEGKSQRAIAEILEAEGVPLPPGRAKTWSQKAVERLFRRFEAAPTPPVPRPAPAPPPPAAELVATAVDELATERTRLTEVVATQAGQNGALERLIERQEAAEARRRLQSREEWRARILPLLLGLLLGAAGTALYYTFGPPGQKMKTYQAAWDVLTPAEREDVNKRLRGE